MDGSISVKLAKSAYLVHFDGVFSKIKLAPIWEAKVEQKCRIFVWTLMHKKILTANNLFKRGWTDGTDCKLCLNGQDQESPVHLCKDCPIPRRFGAI